MAEINDGGDQRFRQLITVMMLVTALKVDHLWGRVELKHRTKQRRRVSL